MRKLICLLILLVISACGWAQNTGSASHSGSAHTSNVKPRTRLLPIGDALAFGSIGTGIVIWLRRRHTF
ncbi:hypothetical protein ACFL6U_24020 [Planctomycetota bacterium]